MARVTSARNNIGLVMHPADRSGPEKGPVHLQVARHALGADDGHNGIGGGLWCAY